LDQQLSDYEYQEMRDTWSDFNHRQAFEHDLINRKTTWLLTTEGLLFTAYGLSSRGFESALRFHNAVAWAGLLIATITLIAVASLINSKRLSWREYRDYYERKESPKPPRPFGPTLAWGVNTWNTRLTLAPDVAIPMVFIGVWWYLLS
jgi:hypothetical protein